MSEAGSGSGGRGITNPYVVRVLSPLHNFSNEPCFRNTFLWGIAAGALMGMHRARVGSTLARACDAAVVTTAVGSCVSWWACNREMRRKQNLIENAFRAQGILSADQVPDYQASDDDPPH